MKKKRKIKKGRLFVLVIFTIFIFGGCIKLSTSIFKKPQMTYLNKTENETKQNEEIKTSNYKAVVTSNSEKNSDIVEEYFAAGMSIEDYKKSIEKIDDYSSLLHESIQGKKIAVIDEILDSITDQDIVNAFNKTLVELEKQGAIIQHVSVSSSLLESILPTYMVISCAEATSNNANLDGIKFGPRYEGNTYEEVMMKARTKGFSELIKRRFVIGSFALMRENQDILFLRAQKNRHKIVDTIQNILKENDVIYLPAAPSIAPKINDSSDRLSDEYLIADNYLAIGNFAGLPSITLPLGFKEHMPFGVNLTGKAFKEAEVLQIAQKVEDITGLYNLSTRREK